MSSLKYKVKIGIIGGTGLDDPENHILDQRIEVERTTARTDFGLPSSNLYHGKINGIDVVLLSRHGSGHTTNPSAVNYRANIEALRLANCTHIVASTACGSLIESISRGMLVIPDSFLDRTVKRETTFFTNISQHYQGVCHIPMEPAFDPYTSEIMLKAAKELGYSIRKGGTVVTIEGPRFSSKAESNAMRFWGGHLINMTTCPEVCLAREAGLLYVAVAMVTDYDCWRDNEEDVHAANVLKEFKRNVNKVTNLFVRAVDLIGKENWDTHIDNLKELVKSSNVSSHEFS